MKIKTDKDLKSKMQKLREIAYMVRQAENHETNEHYLS